MKSGEERASGTPGRNPNLRGARAPRGSDTIAVRGWGNPNFPRSVANFPLSRKTSTASAGGREVAKRSPKRLAERHGRLHPQIGARQQKRPREADPSRGARERVGPGAPSDWSCPRRGTAGSSASGSRSPAPSGHRWNPLAPERPHRAERRDRRAEHERRNLGSPPLIAPAGAPPRRTPRSSPHPSRSPRRAMPTIAPRPRPGTRPGSTTRRATPSRRGGSRARRADRWCGRSRARPPTESFRAGAPAQPRSPPPSRTRRIPNIVNRRKS